jgi:hypothetical protein
MLYLGLSQEEIVILLRERKLFPFELKIEANAVVVKKVNLSGDFTIKTFFFVIIYLVIPFK